MNEKTMKMTQHLSEFVGQKVAILAARYQYRGQLAHVGEDFAVLANACAVESSGPTLSDRPNREDPIGGSVAIATQAIEIVYQPQWAMAPLPSEDGYVNTAEG